MQEIELAWAAGFFDGEGNISFNGNCPRLQVGQKEINPLEVLRFILGVGTIY